MLKPETKGQNLLNFCLACGSDPGKCATMRLLECNDLVTPLGMPIPSCQLVKAFIRFSATVEKIFPSPIGGPAPPPIRLATD